MHPAQRCTPRDQPGRRVSRATRLAAAVAILTLGLGPAARGEEAGRQSSSQVSVQPVTPDEAPTVLLELRVFNGGEDVTGESRVRLFPRGQRTKDVPTTASAGQAITAVVPVGFYDAQAIREKKEQVLDIRWAEQLLVQKYPDEYGRHLEVINFKVGYGALQIRPARESVAAAKGWTAVAYPAGDASREVGKGVNTGEDLLFGLPSGSYDVKITMSDKSTQWIRDMEVPSDRTRLKTWLSGGAR